MTPEDKAALEQWAGQQTCPACRQQNFTVEYVLVPGADPVALAGEQMKVVAAETPVLVCGTEGCDVRSVGKRE